MNLLNQQNEDLLTGDTHNNESLEEQALHLESKKDENKTAINLMSRMMGASVLSGAYIFRFMGLIPTILLLMISIALFVILHNYLLNAIYYTEAKTYKEVVQKITSPKFATALDYIVIFISVGTLTSYLLISSRAIISLLLKYTAITLTYTQLKLIIRPVISFLIIFPLTLLKNTKQLARISPISISAIAVTIMSVIVYFLLSFRHGQSICNYHINNTVIELHNDYRLFSDFPAWKQVIYFVKYIPTLQFTFASPAALPIVYQELQGPSQIRRYMFKLSLLLALIFSMSFYSLISFATSFGFGKYTTDNVMDTFGPCQFVYMDVISIVYAIVLVLAFPLVLQPPRTSLMVILNKTVERNYKAYVMVGLIYLIVTTLLACVVEKIVAIFGLFSAACGFFMYFVVPIAAAFKLPLLKRNSHIPTLKSQLQQHGHIDNLAIALINMMNFKYLTEKTRLMYQKKQQRSKSTVQLKKSRAISTQQYTKQKAFSLLEQKRSIDQESQDKTINLFQLQSRERNAEHYSQADELRLKKFDYAREYSNFNAKQRLIICSVFVGLALVLCTVAFTLNLMDFFTK